MGFFVADHERVNENAVDKHDRQKPDEARYEAKAKENNRVPYVNRVTCELIRACGSQNFLDAEAVVQVYLCPDAQKPASTEDCGAESKCQRFMLRVTLHGEQNEEQGRDHDQSPHLEEKTKPFWLSLVHSLFSNPQKARKRNPFIAAVSQLKYRRLV